jgi:protein disulfide-isomerase A1
MWKLGTLLFLLFTNVVAKFEVESTDGDVLVLDESNFDTTIAEHESGILVEFYAPWCGHCKKLAPEYKKAATKLMDETNGRARLGMVDVTEEKELAERYDIKGFPSLKFFRNGDVDDYVDYDGGRVEREIVAYMKKKTGASATLMVDDAAFIAFAKSNELFVAGFFSDVESEIGRKFIRVAKRIDDLEFIHSPDPSIAAQVTSVGPPPKKKNNQPPDVEQVVGEVSMNSLVLFKNFDETRNVISLEDHSVDELASFVESMSVPKLMEFSPDRTKQIFRGPVKKHLLTFVDAKQSYLTHIQDTLTKLAEKHRGKLLHIWVPSTEDRILSYFGVDKKELPRTVIADLSVEGNMKKYIFTGSKEHSFDELAAFEDSFLAGEIQPWLKSEDDVPSNLKAKVKILVGTTFKDAVLDSGTDALVKFHAPWCGHCKALSPKWDELGEVFAKASDSVIIAKMDATANEVDVPGVILQGFPTIYFFPNKGKPVKYDGGREVEDFVDYIAKHATKPFTLEDGTKGGPHDEL